MPPKQTGIRATLQQRRERDAQEREANEKYQQEHQMTTEQKVTAAQHLRAACRDANAAADMGEDTTAQLRRQGEQMDNMSNNLDTIEYELKVSDRIVKNMSSIGGMISTWFTRKPKHEAQPLPTSTDGPSRSDNRTVETTRPASSSVQKKGDLNPKQQQQQQQPPAESQYDEEEDKLLDELSNNLHVLKNQAHTQRELLDEQQKKLDELNAKTDRVHRHMEKTDRKVRRML